MTARRMYWRAVALVTAAAALPLYVVVETATALRGRPAAVRLDAALDYLDDRLCRIEQQLIAAGSTGRFIDGLSARFNQITNGYDQLLARLAAGRAARPARGRAKK